MTASDRSELSGRPRAHGAAATRRAVLDAAEALFARQGYPATTITEIARHARVGTNTVYVGFSNKPGIVIALIERAADNDVAVGAAERIALAADGRDVIDVLAGATRATHERFQSVVALGLDMAAADPSIGAAMRTAVDGYRDRLRDAVRRLQELGELAESVTEAEAVDLLWFYLGLPPWRTLVDIGWSWDRAHAFLAAGARRAVLGGA